MRLTNTGGKLEKQIAYKNASKGDCKSLHSKTHSKNGGLKQSGDFTIKNLNNENIQPSIYKSPSLASSRSNLSLKSIGGANKNIISKNAF